MDVKIRGVFFRWGFWKQLLKITQDHAKNVDFYDPLKIYSVSLAGLPDTEDAFQL